MMLVKLAIITLRMEIMGIYPRAYECNSTEQVFLKYPRTDNSASLKIKMHEDRYWQNKVTLLLR